MSSKLDELRRRVGEVGWTLREWAYGVLIVSLDDDVEITVRAANHEEAARLLLPWLEPLLAAPEEARSAREGR